jgi:hypothetical protein
MATGDQNDVLQRLKAQMPTGWFGETTPVLDSLLTGFAYVGSYIYSLYAYAVQQSRMLTATDIWLDAFALDFFGLSLQRKAGQSDNSFKAAIIANLFRSRCTRAAIIKVLEDLTGNTPLVFEPTRPMDTGGYGVMMAYDIQGLYGSMAMPYQALVTAYMPKGIGIPNVAGYGISSFAYDTAAQGEYADLSMAGNAVSSSDIYAAIEAVKPIGTTLWVQILAAPLQSALLDETFVLDQTALAGVSVDALDSSFVLDESVLQQPPPAYLNENFTLDTSDLSAP